MKKIAVITSGLLPMPAVKGGAIETLLQYLIDYNEENSSFKFDIYSIYDKSAADSVEKYKNSIFKYFELNKNFSIIYYNFCRILRKTKINIDPNFQKLYIDKVCNEIKNNDYDLILIESDNHFVLPIKKVTTSPIVLYLHNDKLNSEIKNCNEILNSCYQVLTVSEYIRKRVLTVNLNEEKKVISILNGIDTSKFKVDNKEVIRSEFRKKYKLCADDFVFLFTGRIEPNKGVLELVKAFNQIKNEKAKLLILGGSFFSSNAKTDYVKRVEKEINGNKNIIITGYIDHQDIPKYHIMSDCMVSPSQWEEPGSLVNQEAFASGLPLISSYSGGTPEYTKDTSAILIHKDENFISNLSFQMQNLIDDKKLQHKMSESELKVSSYFSKERYCKDLTHYLNEVIKK